MKRKYNEKGAAIVEEAFVLPVMIAMILMIVNLAFWHIGGTAAGRIVTLTQAEVQNEYNFEELFADSSTYEEKLESVLNSINADTGLLTPVEMRVLLLGFDVSNPSNQLDLQNANNASSYEGSFLELSEKECGDPGIECHVYEFQDSNFVKTTPGGIVSTCDNSEVILLRIEYEYKIDNILLGDDRNRVLTTDAINKCY